MTGMLWEVDCRLSALLNNRSEGRCWSWIDGVGAS